MPPGANGSSVLNCAFSRSAEAVTVGNQEYTDSPDSARASLRRESACAIVVFAASARAMSASSSLLPNPAHSFEPAG